MRVVLAAASVLVVMGAVWVFARDLSHDPRSRMRSIGEAAVPLAGVVALVWWSWSAL